MRVQAGPAVALTEGRQHYPGLFEIVQRGEAAGGEHVRWHGRRGMRPSLFEVVLRILLQFPSTGETVAAIHLCVRSQLLLRRVILLLRLLLLLLLLRRLLLNLLLLLLLLLNLLLRLLLLLLLLLRRCLTRLYVIVWWSQGLRLGRRRGIR